MALWSCPHSTHQIETFHSQSLRFIRIRLQSVRWIECRRCSTALGPEGRSSCGASSSRHGRCTSVTGRRHRRRRRPRRRMDHPGRMWSCTRRPGRWHWWSGPSRTTWQRAGLKPDVVIHPGQHCETVDGESLEMSMRLGVRSWGHSRRCADGDPDGHVRTSQRARRGSAGRVADAGDRAPSRSRSAGRPARLRTDQRFARPADHARSAARHADGRHVAGVVRRAGAFGAGVVARPSGPDRRRRVAVDPRRAGTRLDHRHACRAIGTVERTWPGDSLRWWASR